jgi:type II secretory pathway pseudopilin PulG
MMRGFSIIELMIAVTIVMSVLGAVFTLLNPAQGTFQAQPEVSDMQQRLRVAHNTLSKDLLMAGAGRYSGAAAGPLNAYFAPVMPYRVGDSKDDPKAGVFFRPDAISVIYVPSTPSQAAIRNAVSRNQTDIEIAPAPNCPPNTGTTACGFGDGMRIVLFDQYGAADVATVTNVVGNILHLQHDGLLAAPYSAGTPIAHVETHTYYLKTDPAANISQLMHYDGYRSDLTSVDHVVKLGFEYFGEPSPPELLPNTSLSDPQGPWTTYGPRPPVLGMDNPNDSWGPGENCVFQVVSGQQVPRLATLAAGVAQVPVDRTLLTDGPWCPDDSQQDRFDADLLRVRRVRVTLRVQAAAASLRGAAGTLFTRGGTSTSAERYVPDQEVHFDVSPRNLNLAR